jgi:quercetin dioxygenase-like cupin family protein
MDLLQLQQRLTALTESAIFISLQSFQEEFLNTTLEGFKQLAKFDDNNYCSQILFSADKFEIRLLCWKPFQETAKHPHPQNGCLMKILEGKLMEEKYVSNTAIKTIYKKGEVSFVSASELHVLKNSAKDSISLHIYSPGGFYNFINQE